MNPAPKTPADTPTHPAKQSSESDTRRVIPPSQKPDADRSSKLPPEHEKAVPSKPTSSVSTLQREKCDTEACKKPTCAPGQSPGKDKACVPASLAKVNPAAQTAAPPQVCPAGQVWNGLQCSLVGAQQCLPGQTIVGTTCQPDCTVLSAGAQPYIELVRIARQDKDQACIGHAMSKECQSAELTYDMRVNEYGAVTAGVPAQCGLPDAIAIF